MSEGAILTAAEETNLLISFYLGLGLGIAVVLAARMLYFFLRQRRRIDPTTRRRLLGAAWVMGLAVCSVAIAMTLIFLLTPVRLDASGFGVGVFTGVFWTPIVLSVRWAVRAVRRRLGDARRSRRDSDGTANARRPTADPDPPDR